jgi:hypothetical protein
MIEDFWNELKEGEIHVRDNLQFELKSEFFINPHLKQNVYKQEVFLFIPNVLQINSQTYSKQQFYQDQTNLIRYKTPPLPLSNLVDPNDSSSPLIRLQKYLNQPEPNFFLAKASDEVKLFGVIFKSTVREQVYKFVQSLIHAEPQDLERISKSIVLFCNDISQVCYKFRQLQERAKTLSNQQQLIRHFKYVDEFISVTIVDFLIILLKHIRSVTEQDSYTDNQICQLILREKSLRKNKRNGFKYSKERFFIHESVLYRQGLLNHFVLESLMLKNHRFSLEEKHAHFLGAAAAGIAMFVYMGLFVWKFSGFVINSFPFVAFVVFFYILKDRIKEGFKSLYFKQAYRWFPDYSTEIRSPKGLKIGILKENSPLPTESRRKELTAIFRLNIYRFLQKASNAFQQSWTLNPDTQKISKIRLTKVYHLNIIIRNTYLQDDLTPKVEIKTFRVVVDKMGSKRVEHIQASSQHANRTV